MLSLQHSTSRDPEILFFSFQGGHVLDGKFNLVKTYPKVLCTVICKRCVTSIFGLRLLTGDLVHGAKIRNLVPDDLIMIRT